jgi:hypothetical protein
LALVAVIAAGCASKIERKLVRPEDVASLDTNSRYLKAHMHDGHVYLLSEWNVNEAKRTVAGTGDLFDRKRALVETGTFELSIAEVALFETNVKTNSPAIAALAVITGVSAVITVACLANPKACFGSCPTFYVSDGDEMVLQAEGFSASVAPSLEATDVDALYEARPSGPAVDVRMTNEALETHVVRHVDLLVAERPAAAWVVIEHLSGGRKVSCSRSRPTPVCSSCRMARSAW